jgi:6,7-dimethyl-8-ribityllumazine synthase
MQEYDASEERMAIVASRYNESFVDALVAEAEATLRAASIAELHIDHVPGAAELPYAAATLAATGRFDAIIAVGVVIAGDTNHHEIIGESTAQALVQLSLDQRLPIINGILVVHSKAQAEARCGTQLNRGREFAQAALAMATFRKKWTT